MRRERGRIGGITGSDWGDNGVGLGGNGVGLDGEQGRTGWRTGSDWGERSRTGGERGRTGGLVFMKSDILIYAQGFFEHHLKSICKH